MNRRSFLASLAASASALVLPYEPKHPPRIWSYRERLDFARKHCLARVPLVPSIEPRFRDGSVAHGVKAFLEIE